MAKISNELLKAAQNAQEKYGIPTAFTLSIAGAETSFGTKGTGASKNNLFGMKNGNGQFKTYSSIAESVEDFATQLTGAKGTALSKAYAESINGAKTISEFVDGMLENGWTSDKGYKEMVVGVYNDLVKDKDLIASIGSIDSLKINQENVIENTASDTNDLKWWGDFLVVLLCILIVIGGIVFLALSVADSTNFSLKKGVDKLADK